jgi:hypothetical protein
MVCLMKNDEAARQAALLLEAIELGEDPSEVGHPLRATVTALTPISTAKDDGRRYWSV